MSNSLIYYSINYSLIYAIVKLGSYQEIMIIAISMFNVHERLHQDISLLYGQKIISMIRNHSYGHYHLYHLYDHYHVSDSYHLYAQDRLYDDLKGNNLNDLYD